MYQLYLATREWVEHGQEMESMSPGHKIGRQLTWDNAGQNLRLDYHWSPVVNDSMLRTLEQWRTGHGPTVLIIGAALTSIRVSNNSDQALDYHRRNLTKLR